MPPMVGLTQTFGSAEAINTGSCTNTDVCEGGHFCFRAFY